MILKERSQTVFRTTVYLSLFSSKLLKYNKTSKWRNDRRSELNLCNCVKKPEKNLGLQRGLNPWPRDTGAMLYQLSYEATDVGSRSIVRSYISVKEMSDLFHILLTQKQNSNYILGFYTFRELRQRRRQRQRKRHSKSEFALLQTSCWRFFQELNSKGLYLSSQKENRCHVFPSSIKVILQETIRSDDL